MQVVRDPLNAFVQTSGVSRDTGRGRVFDNGRETALDRNSQTPVNEVSEDPGSGSDAVFISDAARQSLAQQEVIPVNRGESSRPSYQYDPFQEASGLSASQQKALQAYSSNQQFNRELEGSGEYLGGVDIIV